MGFGVRGIGYRVPELSFRRRPESPDKCSEAGDSCFRRNDTVGEPSSQQLIPETSYPLKIPLFFTILHCCLGASVVEAAAAFSNAGGGDFADDIDQRIGL